MTGLSVLCIWSDKLSKNTYICPVNRQIKEDGELLSRLVVNGNNYQIWQVQPYFDELAVIKEEGQWTYANGYINLTPTSKTLSTSAYLKITWYISSRKNNRF